MNDSIQRTRTRPSILRTASLLVAVCSMAGMAAGDALTLPPDRRPAWLREDGIVMAGSWEPLAFRLRRDGGGYREPTAEERAAYAREHSPETLARLKAMGVNFVMMHSYKGAGIESERESMADAVRFAARCREAGLRVGVYAYSGAFLWEPFFREMPGARDWILRNAKGDPVTYGQAPYRYYWDRNHPEARAFYRRLVRFAVEEIKTDLVHLDNYHHGPGSDRNSTDRFRAHLATRLTARQRQAMGITDADAATAIPPIGKPDSPLFRAWQDFTCQSMADSYADMSRTARSLRADILMECNPQGVGETIAPPIDHGRILRGGEAFWAEGMNAPYDTGGWGARLRTYKVARRMNNIVFAYTTTPVEAAEAMAFNPDCLGCIAWFEFANLVNRPGWTNPVAPSLMPYVEFFRGRRELFRDTTAVADAAVLRSFPSQTMADRKFGKLTARAERTLIEGRLPFEIVHDTDLADLATDRVLVLAGCVALADSHVDAIRRFAARGGRICTIGPLATHDEWMIPRAAPALADLPAGQWTLPAPEDDLLSAVRRLCPSGPSVRVEGPPGLVVEMTRQARRTLVHLVNYRPEVPAANVRVRMRGGWAKAPRVSLASPEARSDATVPCTLAEGRIEFTIPSVGVYAIAIVDDCRSGSADAGSLPLRHP